MNESRRLLRFSTRHLVIAFAMIAVLLAWYVRPLGPLPKKTGRELDIAIFGRGWLKCSDDSGDYYTRYGSLSISPDGMLVVGRIKDGLIIEPPICVPADWHAIHISPRGEVSAETGDLTVPNPLGMLSLARFVNPEGLREVHPGIYSATEDSGTEVLGQPGTAGLGFIKQRWVQDTGSRHQFSLRDLVLVSVMCISGWTLHEVRKLKPRIDALSYGRHLN